MSEGARAFVERCSVPKALRDQMTMELDLLIAEQTMALRAALKLEHENTLHGSPSTHRRIGDTPGCEVCALLLLGPADQETRP